VERLTEDEASTRTAVAGGPRVPAGAGGGSRRDLSALARGGALNLVGGAADAILGFLLVLVVTRGLGPVAAGPFFVAVALFKILSNTAELGADTGLMRMIPRYRVLDRIHDIRRSLVVGLGPVVVVATVLGTVAFVLAPQLSELLSRGDPGQISPYIRLLALFLPLSAVLTVSLAATRGFGTMLPAVAVDRIGRAGLQPLLVFAVIAAGFGSRAIALAWAVPIGIGMVAAVIWLLILLDRAERGVGPRSGPGVATRALAGEFWRFTAPRGLAGFFHVSMLLRATLLLGALASTREAGIYAASTRYLLVGTLAGVAVLQVTGPKISELLASHDRDRAAVLYQTATAWLMVLVWPLYLTIAIFAPLLLDAFGPGFASGQAPLLILGLTMLVTTGTGPVDVVLLMGGKSSWNLLNTLVAVTLNVVLNIVLIPPFGIVGAAVAWSASLLVNNLAPLVQVRRFLGLHPFGPAFPRVALAALASFGAIGLVVRLVAGTSFPAFVLSVAISTAAYLAFLWMFRGALRLRVLRAALRPSGGEPVVPAR
jgi:O-antigen/teichoic acid export membrane protein